MIATKIPFFPTVEIPCLAYVRELMELGDIEGHISREGDSIPSFVKVG